LLSQLVCMLELWEMDLHVTDGWVGQDSMYLQTMIERKYHKLLFMNV